MTAETTTSSLAKILKNKTQRVTLEILSDWKLHSISELLQATCVSHDSFKVQMGHLRRKLQKKDRDIVIVRKDRWVAQYRLVSLIDPDAPKGLIK